MSDLLSDPKHFRADSRLIAKMISLGVVDEERARGLLSKAIEMAEKARSPRGLATILRALVALARLEQTERLSKQPTKLDVTIHDLGTGGLSRREVLLKERERLQSLIDEADAQEESREEPGDDSP